MATALPPPVRLTERAADRIKELIAKADKPILGLRIGVRTRGCSGLTYFMEYAEDQKKFEDRIEDRGVTVFIDPTASMFLIGTEMDYVQEDLGARFVFNNPNETSRCGCGESFNVAQQDETKDRAAAG